MFLGLPLRSKSVLRNSGRICLASRSQGNVCFASSSTTERARLPHWNEATCGFRSPALVGRIDFGEIELRGKRPDRVPLLADCSFRLLRTKLFFAAKDFVLLVYSLLPSCFALETANAVPPCQGGADRFRRNRAQRRKTRQGASPRRLLVSAFKDKTIFCCQGFCTFGVQSFAFVFRLRDGECRSA